MIGIDPAHLAQLAEHVRVAGEKYTAAYDAREDLYARVEEAEERVEKTRRAFADASESLLGVIAPGTHHLPTTEES